MLKSLLQCTLTGSLLLVGAAGCSSNGSDDLADPISSPGLPSSDLPGIIAFASDRGNGWDIYTVNASDGAEVRLTIDPGEDREPAWSPDGARLAFQSSRGGSKNVYLMSATGADQTAFRPGTDIQGGPKWSPDGSQLAYYSFLAAEAGYLWIADVAGPDFYPLLRSIHPSTPEIHCGGGFPGDWIDNDTVLFRGAWGGGKALELCTVKTDETAVTPILSETGIMSFYPSLSPDGTTIAYSRQPQDQTHDDLYLVSAEGRNPLPLLATPDSESYPTWSPDGEWIAFTSAADGDAEIYAIRKNGTDLRKLTDNDTPDLEPAWSPASP